MKPRDELNASLNSRDEPMTTSPDPITPEDRLAREYRPSMDRDVLHAWAVDAVAALREAATTIKALTEERDEARASVRRARRAKVDIVATARNRALQGLDYWKARALSVERKLEEVSRSQECGAEKEPLPPRAEPSAAFVRRVAAIPLREIDLSYAALNIYYAKGAAPKGLRQEARIAILTLLDVIKDARSLAAPDTSERSVLAREDQ